MALATLNLAFSVKFIAIPVLAGLAAGTGAVAAYVTGPTPAVSAAAAASAGTAVAALPSISAAPAPVAAEQATPAKPNAKPSCEQQTWPYLDNRCIARGNDAARKVRMVMAPRGGDAIPNTAAPNLVTSDTVLRGPGVAPEAEQPVVKKPSKRSETRRQRTREVASRDGFNRVYSVYSVPSADSTKPVIVIRPLRLDSSRF